MIQLNADAVSEVQQLVDAVFSFEIPARQATKYLSPNLIVNATRMRKPDGRAKSTNILLTIGKPNFRQRAFIKACQKAGEPFPVKNMQLKFYK